ncbi:MAG: hypothetical protein IPM83_01285 [Ignavibacteria bacterium]|nr:hypothetical protein [Ignavibacteria bacterium]
MAKGNGSASNSLHQQIEIKIVDFLRSTSPEELNAEFPDNTDGVTAWYYTNHEWKVGDEDRSQWLLMLDETAVRFFQLTEFVFEQMTKSKPNEKSNSGVLISENSVTEVLISCIARFAWHSINIGITDTNQFVRRFLNETLFSTPRPFVLLMPVYGLTTESAVLFRNGQYSRPKELTEYVERLKRLKKHADIGLPDPESEDMNSGRDVVVRVVCLARFQEEAMDIGMRLISNDLAILRYGSTRQYRGGLHLASPGITNLTKERPSIATMVFDGQGKGNTYPGGYKRQGMSPLKLQAWTSSKWAEAVSTADKISEAKKQTVATKFLDAMTWLGRAVDITDEATRLLFQVTALEALLPLDGKEEKVHQVSLLTTVLGEFAGYPRKETYELIKRAYSVRSEIVHGSRMTTSKYEPDRIQRLLDRIMDFLLFNEQGKEMLSLSGDAFRLKLMEKLFEK